MLPKERRLTKKEFNNIFNNSVNVESDVGYFKVGPINGVSKFACVATKKMNRTSVDRTRIRRRGYAAFTQQISNVPDGYGVIWFLPPKANSVEFSLLVNAVKNMILHLNDV